MGVMRLRYATLLFAVLLGCCSAQNATYCQESNTCAECIEVGPRCGWCAENDFVGIRCNLAADLLLSNCSDVQNPEPFAMNITKDESLSNAGDAALGMAVQVQPQEIHLKLRRGETAQIMMNVRQAEDYPVDLYYLMDLSQSMKEDLVNLRRIASGIVDLMQGLTRNFRVGFGSFVDKNVSPFAAILADGTLKLCDVCASPYLFKNALSLTNNTGLFTDILEATGYSTSKDSPEAGFDALMQVAVCGEEIGWRESARHLVVYASDAPFHTAGDGRLGGILTPNDGKCYVDATGNYNSDVMMDYPSLGHLSMVIEDQDIIVMFVVTSDNEPAYKELLDFIPGSQTGLLATNSENILYWIDKLYQDITSEVELTVRVPDEILLEFTSQCQDGVSTPNSRSCSDLTIGDTVSFLIDVTAESCVTEGSTSFTVSPVGFSEELVVNVEIVCDCDCEDSGITNSPACNGNGTLECGQCDCNTGRFGEYCQCSGESTAVGDDLTACMTPNSVSVCSGRGECFCGECVCNKQADPTHVVSGMYCQCDNFNCPLSEGQLCGGPAHGQCECDPTTQQSKCMCTSEYMGDSCNCLRSHDNCIAPNGLLCNAHGTCTCGACKCDASSPFKGETCFDCATCSGQCEVYQECVQCKAFESGPLTPEECAMCTVDVITVAEFPEVDNPQNCSVTHTDNCSIVFILYYDNGEDNIPVIYVLEDTECPVLPPGPGVNVQALAIGIAVLIVIIGIILIILYKCYLMYLDRKEYEDWLREKQNAKFSQNENPLYKAPKSLHMNPAYGAQFSDEDAPVLEKKAL